MLPLLGITPLFFLFLVQVILIPLSMGFIPRLPTGAELFVGGVKAQILGIKGKYGAVPRNVLAYFSIP